MDDIRYRTTTVGKALGDIVNNKAVLPSIQRKFIWNHKQVVSLFDSLVKDYPIGTFLLWEIKGEKAVKNYVFYRFIKDIRKNSNWNDKILGHEHSDILALLDGQQRMTALYSGIYGTFTYKTKYKHKSKKESYYQRYLHYNILFGKNEKDNETGFKYISEKDGKTINSSELWFRIGHNPNFRKPEGTIKSYLTGYIEDRLNEADEKEARRIIEYNRRAIRETVTHLYRTVIEGKVTQTIVTTPDLDEVLDVFIRVNSGGIKLSKADLLFSTITAKWEEAREEIDHLLQSIEAQHFFFNTDLVMRTCLMLTDSPILFRVNSFSKQNIEKITVNWSRIKDALLRTVDLWQKWSVSDRDLKSKNSIIPITYFIHKNPTKPSVSDQKELKKYLVHVHLKNTYGSHGDTVLNNIRNILTFGSSEAPAGKKNRSLRLHSKEFKFQQLLNDKYFSHGEKSLQITSRDMDEWFTVKKGNRTYMVLSILYPALAYREYHQDHIHAKNLFSDENLSLVGFPEGQFEQLRQMKDLLPNLQLLSEDENKEKQDQYFSHWLQRQYPNTQEREDFFKRNSIPPVNLNFSDFEGFFMAREALLKKELRRKLEIADIDGPIVQ